MEEKKVQTKVDYEEILNVALEVMDEIIYNTSRLVNITALIDSMTEEDVKNHEELMSQVMFKTMQMARIQANAVKQ